MSKKPETANSVWSRTLDVAERMSAGVAILTMLAMMVHVVSNAILRTVANKPMSGTLELVTYWYMPVLVTFGFFLATKRHELIEATMLFDHIPRVNQVEWLIFSKLVLILLCGGFTWFSYQEAQHNFEIKATGGVTGMTIWPVTYLVPLAFASMVLLSVAQLVQLVRTREIPGDEHDSNVATIEEGL